MITLFIKMKQQIGLQYYKLKVRYCLWREKVIFLHRVSITNPPLELLLDHQVSLILIGFRVIINI